MPRYISDYHGLMFGCDPEFFLTDPNGQVIGSERVLPPDGLATLAMDVPEIYRSIAGERQQDVVFDRSLVLDGVQVELNPKPAACRANLGNEIQYAFRALKRHLDKQNGVGVTFDAVVTVSKEELAKLSEKSREFGCAPSENYYDTSAKIVSNPKVYKKRSAGGHIHLGLYHEMLEHRKRLVPILDTILGNTCVLIDRDPEAAERRKNYGRAGEHRLPEHGLEYRTLSNFWLRSYPLLSLVLGLSRMSACVLSTTLVSNIKGHYANTWSFDAEGELMRKVDLDAVVRAINTNDLELAKRNYLVVRDFIATYVTSNSDMGLSAPQLNNFDFFCDVVANKGIQFWFPDDPLTHWCNKPEGHGSGWETFLANTVSYKRMESTNGRDRTGS